MTNSKKAINMPNADLIKTLCCLLKRAEKGSLQGVVFILLDEDGTSSHGWSGIVDQPAQRSDSTFLVFSDEFFAGFRRFCTIL